MLPFGIAVSKQDRLIVSSKVLKTSPASIYFNVASNNDNTVLMHWDSYLAEAMCSNFAFDTSNTFTATLLLSTATPLTISMF